MKCKVKLTHTVTLFVEGESEEQILDWLARTTPQEAYLLSEGTGVDSDYDEEIICAVRDDSEVDYVIKEED